MLCMTYLSARGLFSDVIQKHSKRSRDEVEGMSAVHLKSRRTPYPMSSIERYPLLDNQIDWKVSPLKWLLCLIMSGIGRMGVESSGLCLCWGFQIFIWTIVWKKIKIQAVSSNWKMRKETMKTKNERELKKKSKNLKRLATNVHLCNRIPIPKVIGNTSFMIIILRQSSWGTIHPNTLLTPYYTPVQIQISKGKLHNLFLIMQWFFWLLLFRW